MKPAWSVILLVLCALSAHADLTEGPDYTILYNKFTAVCVVDGFAVGVAPGAIVVCHYHDTLAVFVPENIEFVDFNPKTIKHRQDLLQIRTSDDRIAVYDLSNLPHLTHLGTIDVGRDYADFTLHGNDLYLSVWFGGIRRYRLNGYSSATFVDFSRIGRLMTQLEVEDDTLYALDEYNGIMRYDLADTGFGRFVDYLWLPAPIASFMKLDSVMLLASLYEGVLIGEFGHPGSGIIDRIGGVVLPHQMLVIDTFLVFLNPRSMQIISRNDHSQRRNVPLSETLIAGDVFMRSDRFHLLLPGTNGGLTSYQLSEPDLATPGLYRCGPINDLLFHDGKLFTGGGDNPIDVFTLDADATPKSDYTMFSGLTNVRALDRNGDSLIVYYQKLGTVSFIANSSAADSFALESSISVVDSTVRDIQYYGRRIGSVHPLLAVGKRDIQAFAVTDDAGVHSAGNWSSLSSISSVLLHDSLLLVGNSKNQLWAYSIDSDFSRRFESFKSLTGPPAKIMALDERILVFVRDQMVVMDYSDPVLPQIDTSIQLPVSALDAVIHGDRLYTVGPEGVCVCRLDGVIPQVLDFGGQPGSMIDVSGNVLATSDGGSIHIYRLPEHLQPSPTPQEMPAAYALSQNYPNPFNTGTRIDFNLTERGHVRLCVYNVLGQNVVTLIDGPAPSGDNFTFWDGTDNSGGSVASGVYFYRLEVDNRQATKKMILLK